MMPLTTDDGSGRRRKEIRKGRGCVIGGIVRIRTQLLDDLRNIRRYSELKMEAECF